MRQAGSTDTEQLELFEKSRAAADRGDWMAFFMLMGGPATAPRHMPLRPAYVERDALNNPKQRNRAKKAIHKATQNQVEKRGFSFVEVLAECPTHLKATPEQAEKWVEDVGLDNVYRNWAERPDLYGPQYR